MSDRGDMFPEEFPPIPLEEIDLAPQIASRSEEMSYETLVLTAFSAAVTVLLAKIAAILLIGNFSGATTTVQFFLGFVPYFGIIAAPSTVAFTANDSLGTTSELVTSKSIWSSASAPCNCGGIAVPLVSL